MERETRTAGPDIVADVAWGSHLCQFYESREDLADILVPYFKAGLERNQCCMWVTPDAISADQARASLTKAVKGLEQYVRKEQIEIVDAGEWHMESREFSATGLLGSWVQRAEWATSVGFDGLRLAADVSWLGKTDRKALVNYEA